MKLETKRNPAGDVLTVAIEGSVDTVTAPDLEKELNGLYEGVKELILDFASVDYVSSAGLRVIMGANQRMEAQGKMTLKNVGEDVREVFEMTGFDDFLTFG